MAKNNPLRTTTPPQPHNNHTTTTQQPHHAQPHHNQNNHTTTTPINNMVNSTPHRTRNMVLACGSRLSRRLEVKPNSMSFERIVCRSRASCLFRTRSCLNTIFNTTFHLSRFFHTFHLFSYHLAMTTKCHRILGQQDYLVFLAIRSPLTHCG